MTQPIVSIIIPCYNAADCVAEAVESALAQTWSRKEIIVVDDGSTDDSRKVLEAFGGRIRTLAQPHRGAAAARNTGLAASRCDFVQFLDADDLLHPQKLSRQLAVINRVGTSIVFCDHQVIDVSGELTSVFYPTHREEDDPVVLVLRRHIQTISPLHPRSTLESVGGFDESLPRCQEFDLHLRIACLNVRFYHLAEPLWIWRRRPGSLSSDTTLVYSDLPQILERAYRKLLAENRMTPERSRAFAARMAGVARQLFRSGRTDLARTSFEKAARMDKGGYLSVYRPLLRPLVSWFGPERIEKHVVFYRRLHSGRIW